MKALHKLTIVAAITAGLSTGLVGCSSSSSGDSGSSGFVLYERVAPLPKQMATISIADPLGTPVMTITQAEKVVINGAVSTNGTNTVTVDMSLTNQTGRMLFNAKVVPTALNQGDLSVNVINTTDNIHNNADSLAGLEYYGFGLVGIEDGDSQPSEDSLTVNGIDGTIDPLVIQVELPTDHSMAYHNSSSWGTVQRVDVMGTRSDSEYYADSESGGAYSDNNNYHQGAQSPDGKTLYFGTRNMPVIIVYDTTQSIDNNPEPRVTRIPLLENPVEQGYTPSVTMSPDGQFLYATVMAGTHEYSYANGSGYNAWPTATYLVKVDATSHNVISRLPVFMPGREGARVKPRDLSITEDGAMGALALDFAGGIALIDLNTMSVKETFDAGNNGFGLRQRVPAISPDGSKIFFSDSSSDFSNTFNADYNASRHIGVIDVETGAFSKLISTDQITDNVRQLQFGPDGRLYHVGDDSQINVYDVNTMTQVAVYDESTSCYQFAFNGEGTRLYAFCGNTEVYDISDDTFTGLDETNGAGQAFGLVSPY